MGLLMLCICCTLEAAFFLPLWKVLVETRVWPLWEVECFPSRQGSTLPKTTARADDYFCNRRNWDRTITSPSTSRCRKRTTGIKKPALMESR